MKEKTYATRRTFSVKGQLLGKLGSDGFGQLLNQLGAVSSKTPVKGRNRRRRRGPKTVQS